MSYENILYEVQGPMALITINRADRHNAISLGTLAELQASMSVDDGATTAGDIFAVFLDEFGANS